MGAQGEGKARARTATARTAPHFRGRVSLLADPPKRVYATSEEPLPLAMADELGRTGIPSGRAGIPTQETNRDLSPYRARGFNEDPGVFDEMLRTDGTVAGTLALVSREISRARWVIEAPHNPSRKEAEAAELAARFLGLDGREPWLYGGLSYHLRLAVKALAYGFSPFEVTWQRKMWTKVPVMVPSRVRWRAPQSIAGWAWDGDDLAGMIQTTERKGGASALLGKLLGKDQTVTIPVRQLLLYTYDETEGCPEGLSIYRPAWIWWRSKRDILNRYQMTGELLTNGVIRLKPRYDGDGRALQARSQQDVDDFGDIYGAWVDGAGWLEEAEGWEIDQQFPDLQASSPEGMLSYCDGQIRTVFLAQLLGVGSDGTASLSSSLGQLLYNSIDAIASWIAEVLNGQPGRPHTGLIKPMIDANISHNGELRYPRLVARGLEHQDTKAWVDAATKAAQFGLLWYTSGVEDEMRLALDMPPLTQDERELRDAWAQGRFASGDVTSMPAPPIGASGQGERASEEGTQGDTVEAPQEMPVQDPDGA